MSICTELLCHLNINTNECFKCPLTNRNTEIYNGTCIHYVVNIFEIDINNEWTSHGKCETYEWNYLPSTGTNGGYCICIKHKSINANCIINGCQTLHLLFKSNFEHGTYIMNKCGGDILQENISLNTKEANINIRNDIFNGY